MGCRTVAASTAKAVCGSACMMAARCFACRPAASGWRPGPCRRASSPPAALAARICARFMWRRLTRGTAANRKAAHCSRPVWMYPACRSPCSAKSEQELRVGNRLAGKKALVYGGGTGIGLACAEAMAREGATVFISGRREGVIRDAVEGLKAHGKAGFAAGDATVAADVQRVTASAVQFMGGLDTI